MLALKPAVFLGLICVLGEQMMAQYDVFTNPSHSAADGIPYVVVIQSDLLDALATRLTTARADGALRVGLSLAAAAGAGEAAFMALRAAGGVLRGAAVLPAAVLVAMAVSFVMHRARSGRALSGPLLRPLHSVRLPMLVPPQT